MPLGSNRNSVKVTLVEPVGCPLLTPPPQAARNTITAKASEAVLNPWLAV
jgi:hypothetical protein